MLRREFPNPVATLQLFCPDPRLSLAGLFEVELGRSELDY
jgi:hypothetical protein